MSKYHILKSSDFHKHDDAVNESATITISSSDKAIVVTDDEENVDLLHAKGSHQHRPTNHDQLRLEQQNKHQQYLRSRYNDDDGDHYGADLIQHNNNIVDSRKPNIYKNNNNKTNNSEKDIFTNVNITSLNSADDAACEDYTMEVPLLQQNKSQYRIVDRKEGPNNNKQPNQHFDRDCVCLCKQKGFASHLSSDSSKSAKLKILWAIALCCIFMVVEFLGGYLAGSLAIMTDAAHLASDCVSFIIGIVAICLGNKPPDTKMSFGYKRFEVMGATASILGIWILTATLVLVAIQRIYSNDYDLDANTMMTISGIGILINIIMIFILHTSVLDLPIGIASAHGHSHSHSHNGHHGHSPSHSHSQTLQRSQSSDSGHIYTESTMRSLLSTDDDADANAVLASTVDVESGQDTLLGLSSCPITANDGNNTNINLRAAMIHVIGDLVQSFGVFLASVLIKIFPKAVFLDPLCTLLFSIIVIMTTVNLFKESIHLLMDSIPQGLSIDDLKLDLLNIEGVISVHHLNVWNHTSNYSILMVHLVIDIPADSNAVIVEATKLACSSKYHIKHSTIQIERVAS